MRSHHQDIVVRCLIRAAWSIIREQYALVVAEGEESSRHLLIDIAAQSRTGQIALILIKSPEPSPVRQFMLLLGQHVFYQVALGYIGDAASLYVAISEADHELMIEQTLGQAVIRERLTEPIPSSSLTQ